VIAGRREVDVARLHRHPILRLHHGQGAVPLQQLAQARVRFVPAVLDQHDRQREVRRQRA
jgi:hypothetical protein